MLCVGCEEFENAGQDEGWKFLELRGDKEFQL